MWLYALQRACTLISFPDIITHLMSTNERRNIILFQERCDRGVTVKVRASPNGIRHEVNLQYLQKITGNKSFTRARRGERRKGEGVGSREREV